MFSVTLFSGYGILSDGILTIIFSFLSIINLSPGFNFIGLEFLFIISIFHLTSVNCFLSAFTQKTVHLTAAVVSAVVTEKSDSDSL